MNTVYAALLTASAQISKLLVGFVLLKMIAYYLGAAGLGALGHFMSMVTIVSMLAGGGITNGIIKYVAEYRFSPRKMLAFISSSVLYALVFSLVFLVLGIVFSRDISLFIFGSSESYWLIVFLAFAQLGFAFINLVTGVSNGLSDTKTYAKIQIAGNALGLPMAYFLLKSYGVPGAALGILAILVAQLLPAYYFFRTSPFKGRVFRFKPARSHYLSLSLFTAMLATSVVAFPVIEILVRERLIKSVGYTQAGIWQGAIKLSNAYMSFFGVFLAYYFMPLISAEVDKKIIARHVFRVLLFVMGLFLLGAAILYGWRSFFIPILLSKDFEVLEDFIVFQLIGDFFKISAYVIGFVGVAKAATKLYIGAEVFQSVGFFGLSIILGAYLPAIEGVFFGYMLTYISYFILSLGIFLWWVGRS